MSIVMTDVDASICFDFEKNPNIHDFFSRFFFHNKIGNQNNYFQVEAKCFHESYTAIEIQPSIAFYKYNTIVIHE